MNISLTPTLEGRVGSVINIGFMDIVHSFPQQFNGKSVR